MTSESARDVPNVHPPSISYRTYRPGDEDSIVTLLNRAYPRPWGTLEQWKLKHRDRPGFNPDEIFVAECSGKIVGCLHTAVRPVRLSPGLTVRQAFDGDLAVHPDYRGLGIPEELYRNSTKIFHERGIELRGGYTSVTLWDRFYKPRIGYVTGFDRTRTLQKMLTAAPVRARLEKAIAKTFGGPPGPGASATNHGAGTSSHQRGLQRVIVELRLKGIDPVGLLLSDHGARVLAGHQNDSPNDHEAGRGSGRDSHRRLIVSTDQRLFSVAPGLVARITLVVRSLLSGGVRVRGLARAGPLVARWVIRNRRTLAGLSWRRR